jgi:hypothetical protein
MRKRIQKFGGVGCAGGVGVGGAVLEKILKVVARREHARATGDDDAADRRIILRGVDRVAHGAIHVLRDRIFLFGPPQRDHARGVFVGDYEVPGHDHILETNGKRRDWRVFQLHPT